MTRDEMKKSAWIMVLNDNETFTGLDGCWLAMTDEQQVEALDECGAIEDIAPRFDMQKLLLWAIDAGYFEEQ